MEIRRRKAPRLRDPAMLQQDDDEADIHHAWRAVDPRTGRRPGELSATQKRGCGLAFGIVVLVIVTAVGVSAATHQGGAGGSGSAAEWTLMRDQLLGHAHELDDNERAVNIQGAANARTKVAKDCRQAGSYQPAGTADETAVRAGCRASGFPIP